MQKYGGRQELSTVIDAEQRVHVQVSLGWQVRLRLRVRVVAEPESATRTARPAWDGGVWQCTLADVRVNFHWHWQRPRVKTQEQGMH